MEMSVAFLAGNQESGCMQGTGNCAFSARFTQVAYSSNGRVVTACPRIRLRYRFDSHGAPYLLRFNSITVDGHQMDDELPVERDGVLFHGTYLATDSPSLRVLCFACTEYLYGVYTRPPIYLPTQYTEYEPPLSSILPSASKRTTRMLAWRTSDQNESRLRDGLQASALQKR
ncbi:hypothetical protein ASPCADRAFT_510355 [Aspergillus carbonarius ITEM 5010]|uniref:Uncharacterized protein n=1 Tax=Aspergillus carbonarius (strain ITEM 5010) TaxID=602072 RepID=A0A1R3R9K3_ASPC5|nr:hypothetical protein ASPCADRAFT_510355 [Aspergillus carbonarius ITEM 5010]